MTFSRPWHRSYVYNYADNDFTTIDEKTPFMASVDRADESIFRLILMLRLSLNFCLCNLHIKRSYFGTLFFLPERSTNWLQRFIAYKNVFAFCTRHIKSPFNAK